jgi:2-keto-3-deoxy-L-rhamnonate aldolase RhmA
MTARIHHRTTRQWPLHPNGELLLGVQIESPEGVSRDAQILNVPRIGLAEMGPGDLGLALGYQQVSRQPYPPEMQEGDISWRNTASKILFNPIASLMAKASG